MKHLTTAAAALFLLAIPGLALAQSDTSGGSGDATGSTRAVGGDSQCEDQTATTNYNSFSEKCRLQIDDWAMSQTGTNTKFEGDVAVGTVVPETVEIIDVPVYKNYGYVMLNDHRVLVDRSSRKVVRIY